MGHPTMNWFSSFLLVSCLVEIGPLIIQKGYHLGIVLSKYQQEKQDDLYNDLTLLVNQNFYGR